MSKFVAIVVALLAVLVAFAAAESSLVTSVNAAETRSALFMKLLSKASDQCCDTDDEEGPCDNPCRINQKKPVVHKQASTSHGKSVVKVNWRSSSVGNKGVRRIVVDKHVTVEASAEEALAKIRAAARKAMDGVADETVVGVKTEKVVAAKGIQKELKVAGAGSIHLKSVASTGVGQEKKVAVAGVNVIKASAKGAAARAADAIAAKVSQWNDKAESNLAGWKKELKTAAKVGVKQEQSAASIGVAAVQEAASHAIQELAESA